MARFFHPLILLLARSTQPQLIRYVEYLKTENRILRSKLPKRITITPAERQKLVKVGKPLGKAIKELITIVTPRTFARWISGEVVFVNMRTLDFRVNLGTGKESSWPPRGPAAKFSQFIRPLRAVFLSPVL